MPLYFQDHSFVWDDIYYQDDKVCFKLSIRSTLNFWLISSCCNFNVLMTRVHVFILMA